MARIRNFPCPMPNLVFQVAPLPLRPLHRSFSPKGLHLVWRYQDIWQHHEIVKAVAALLICTALPVRACSSALRTFLTLFLPALGVSDSMINDFLVTRLPCICDLSGVEGGFPLFEVTFQCLGGKTMQYTVSVDCVKENIRGPLASSSRHPDWRS